LGKVIWACWTSQPSSAPPNTFDSLTAIPGDMPRFPFESSDCVLRVTRKPQPFDAETLSRGGIRRRKENEQRGSLPLLYFSRSSQRLRVKIRVKIRVQKHRQSPITNASVPQPDTPAGVTSIKRPT
jgi:hypothetical protein